MIYIGYELVYIIEFNRKERMDSYRLVCSEGANYEI